MYLQTFFLTTDIHNIYLICECFAMSYRFGHFWSVARTACFAWCWGVIFLTFWSYCPSFSSQRTKSFPLFHCALYRWDSSDQMCIFNVDIWANCLDSPRCHRRETESSVSVHLRQTAKIAQVSDRFSVHLSLWWLSHESSDVSMDAST